MARPRKYNTEEERLAAIMESRRKWKKNNPEKVKESKRKWKRKLYTENPEKERERQRKWREGNPEKEKERRRKYQSTPIGRALNLASAYRQKDKKYNRGKCTLTAKWIVDNVFSGQRRFYCDESDWHKLGCDRIYNSLAHTPENVVPCCEECNTKRGRKDFVDFLKEIGRLDKLKELKDKVIITDEVLID